jgi:hypothetical protein
LGTQRFSYFINPPAPFDKGGLIAPHQKLKQKCHLIPQMALCIFISSLYSFLNLQIAEFSN